MNKKLNIITPLIALSVVVSLGCSTWTRHDTIRQASFTALMAVDYAQTLRIADNPERWHEHNPIMGSHPSSRDVTLYFMGSYAVSTAVAMLLPPPYRAWWQYSAITVEAACVGNNYTIGLGWGL
jgi:hypothetical protein